MKLPAKFLGCLEGSLRGQGFRRSRLGQYIRAPSVASRLEVLSIAGNEYFCTATGWVVFPYLTGLLARVLPELASSSLRDKESGAILFPSVVVPLAVVSSDLGNVSDKPLGQEDGNILGGRVHEEWPSKLGLYESLSVVAERLLQWRPGSFAEMIVFVMTLVVAGRVEEVRRLCGEAGQTSDGIDQDMLVSAVRKSENALGVTII